MARTSKRIGVVLFQLGGPDSLGAVEPFLYNLFCDPDIIEFPSRIGRRPLARLIARARAKSVWHHYQTIGGGSPIRRLTEEQAAALQTRLTEEGVDARCVVAMRYWHPLTGEAVAQLERADIDQLVLLPMYPQFSRTTTGSSLNEWNRLWRRSIPTFCIGGLYRNPLYLAALVEKIDQTLARFSDPATAHLVFSAHGLPISVIEKGDPYQREIEETVALVLRRGAWVNPYRLCYQSKVGAGRWLQPSLRATLRQLAAEKARDVCVIPISFVSDHVETLGEIDHEAREEARSLGIRQFEMTPGLNDSPKFIQALAASVIEALQEPGPVCEPQGRSLAVQSTAAL